MKPTPSKKESQRFLDLLDPNGMFTFQTFDDDQDRKDKRLAKILHGTLDQHYEELAQFSAQGAGIFVCVNETDLRGRKNSNIQRIRACFVDLDGAPLKPVIDHPCEPGMVIESSPGRWHVYYPCQDMPLDQFTPMQRAIAATFDGDKACCDLPRVMRLPGFPHQKVRNGVRSEPFMSRIESAYSDLRYSHEQLLEAFPASDQTNQAPPGSDLPVERELDPSKLRDALTYVDPEPRDTWVKVGHALKTTDPDLLALYLEWSKGDLTGRRPQSYTNDADVIATWNSFSPKRISISAIFAMAKENGYVSARCNSGLRLGTQVEIAKLLRKEIQGETNADLVYSEGRFWRYCGTQWEEMPESALRQQLHKLDGVPCGSNKILRMSRNFIDGTLRELAAMVDSPNFFEASAQGVNLLNGFVRISDIGRVSLEPHSPDHRQRFSISQNWQPSLSEISDGFMQKLLWGSFGVEDGDSHQLIIEIIGAAISGINTNLPSPKAFVFHGASAANGKSTIQALMRSLLPRNVIACVSPGDLGEPQFLATLAGCQVNLTDELSSSKAIATDRFKATVTGDPVQAKAIYREPFTFTPRALHVFSANHLPSFSGGVDNGIMRRIVVVPFSRSIPEAERIPDLAAKIIEHEGDMLVSLAIQAAAGVVARGHYTIPPKCEAATAQWFRDVDPVAEWFEDGGLERHVHTGGMLVRELYVRFRQDVADLGILHVPGQSRFTQRLRERVESCTKWEIVRRNTGEMVFPLPVVSKVTKISPKA